MLIKINFNIRFISLKVILAKILFLSLIKSLALHFHIVIVKDAKIVHVFPKIID